MRRRFEPHLPRGLLSACAWPVTMVLAFFLLTAPLPGRLARAAPSLPATCRALLVLSLQPGEHGAGGAASGPIAADIPLDPVLIALPLYPGAQPTTRPAPAGKTSTFSPYEKSASAAYLLPTDPQTALTWYVKAMGSCGYLPAGEGQTAGGGTTWTLRDFGSPTIPSAQIELSFAAAPQTGTGTILAAYAAALSLPQRPRQSELTQSYRQVDITYRTQGFSPPGKHLHIHVTERQQPWIGELVSAVNTPDEILAAPHSCGGRDWIVGLQFYPRTGKPVTVTLQCGDLQVGRYPELLDPGKEALLTVQKVILVSCQSKACKEIAQWPG